LRDLEADPEQKGETLSALVGMLRDGGQEKDQNFYECDAAQFSVVPGSPFAYWVGEPIRRIFREFPALEGSVGTVRVGLQTSDDFRFIRAWWEVGPDRIGFSPEDTEGERGWVHFAKGGSYSPYYADVHLVVNWSARGAEIKNFYKPSGRLASRPQNEDYYFRPGLTWPRRTQSGLSVRGLPGGCAFGDKGPAISPGRYKSLTALVGIANSGLFRTLVEAQMAFGSYEVGVLQRTPMPADVPETDEWDAGELVRLARAPARSNEVTHDFGVPSLVTVEARGVSRAGLRLEERERNRLAELVDGVESVEERVRSLYGIEEGELTELERSTARLVAEEMGDDGEEDEPAAEDQGRRVANLLMWCVGVAFGRWDVRMARDESLIPELQGPFERLPRVAPAGLVGPDGLPATRSRIASEAWLRARPNVISLPEPGSFEGPESITAEDYPIDVAWNGILVDDPDHPWDLVGKVREVLRYVYGPERAQAIEDEVLESLRADGRTPRTLRDWFRNQKATELGRSFFDFHIRRYSKSRRKAPIYWRLCTSPGRGQSDYGVWLYYHRLTDDTLWTVLNEYVRPRVEREERKAEELRERIGGAEGGAARGLEKEREEALSRLEELRWFEGEVRKVAEGGWAPDLDDGVVINLAPLHAVVPWKAPEKIWKKLEKGECDWSKLAMRYWPDRVREACRTNKSFAIAHNLEDLFEER